MSIKITTWDEEKTKEEIRKRFKQCLDSRTYHEERWIRNEGTIFSTTAGLNGSYLKNSLEANFNVGMPGVDGSTADNSTAYVMKNFRFIHAQMSANPPSVAMRPVSSDQDDHRKADAADRIVRWAIRKYAMQEKSDQHNLHALLYGTGFMKTVWDSTRGDIVDFDEKTGEMRLEGDIAVTVPFIWNMFIDPDAHSWDEVKYVFERVYMDYNEACARWPEKEEYLKQALTEKTTNSSNKASRETQLPDKHYSSVELLEYWETGLPTNGYLGRYCITTMSGEVIEKVRPSPFRFKRAGAVSQIEDSDLPDEIKEAKIERLPEQAELPYHILTDIDVPNMVWGCSFIQYVSQQQENLNRLDSSVLDNIQAHGAIKLVLPESAEIDDEALSNSPWDVLKITGNQPPYHLSVPALMPEMTSTRQNIIQGINDISGVNDSMFGNQQRETSGASMQYATNQGNMIRRRLFNKYVASVESIYRGILNLVRKHWSVSRTIHVLGKEKALEAIDLKGTDIDGGYDVVGEYGVTLSLDPITRREEILTLQPMFEKAGVPMRTALKMLKLNELEGMYDKLELAGNRQKEIFDEMIATGKYIKPKKYRDHENMIAWALDYFMSSEFETLPESIQALCEAHIEERAAVAAQEKSGNATQAPGVPTGSPTEQLPAETPGPAPSGPAGEVPAAAGAPAGPLPG